MVCLSVTTLPMQQSGGGALGIVIWLVIIAFLLLPFAGMWKTFEKADRPGWAAIIPIYNMYVMLKIGDNEWWWLLVIIFVPIVNFYGMYKMFAGVANGFGKGIGWALGLWLLPFIFFPIIGFGDHEFRRGTSGGEMTGSLV